MTATLPGPAPMELMPPATPMPVQAWAPSECDVCGLPLAVDDEYRPMSIVSDATPRTLRETRGSGFIENEWRLEAVCDGCHGRFLHWLCSSREDHHEADTIPAPPSSPVESPELGNQTEGSRDLGGGFELELEPLAAPAPNRS